jgi:hypothetical protein
MFVGIIKGKLFFNTFKIHLSGSYLEPVNTCFLCDPFNFFANIMVLSLPLFASVVPA